MSYYSTLRLCIEILINFFSDLFVPQIIKSVEEEGDWRRGERREREGVMVR